jgi:guanosine-3',5'-bis(diphosphate) 3'-pyrophosphohydrolase
MNTSMDISAYVPGHTGNLFSKAIIYAVAAHAGMVRKGTATPYIVHPMEAAAIAATMTDDIEILTAAVLHDTIEDTCVTAEDLRREFGDRIAKIVSAESEDKREDRPSADTWMERKQETIDHLTHSADENEMIVALADKLSNIRAIDRDYLAEGEGFWQRFNQKDKQMHAWYYRAVGSALSGLARFSAYTEYVDLVGKVFDSPS